MIITRTPLRISFFGGGTDLPSFYEKEGGCVISTTINKYVYLVGHRSFDDNFKIHYNKVECVNNISEIQNTRVKEIFTNEKLSEKIELYSIGVVPQGTGLGSSSSFAVGLLQLVKKMKGENPTKEELATGACEIEIEKLGEPIGKQDQYAAAFGGFNFIEFSKTGDVKVERISLPEDTINELQKRIVVFYLGKTRSAAEILKEQNKNITSNEDKFNCLKKLKQICLEMKEDLQNNNIKSFGKLLHESWLTKRQLASSISDEYIDNIYKAGIEAGAEGGKVLGAGGGGFILFYCEPERQAALKNSLSSLKEFNISFEKDGSQIIYTE